MMTMVLIRHGQSMWNAAHRFTGWVDVPLSDQGVAEATAAGRQLNNITFDLVYVSDLMRTHETALALLKGQKEKRVPVFSKASSHERAQFSDQNALDNSLDMHQLWQLNERCYGDLQGLHKPTIVETYGAEQVQAWRRGYHISPPGGESMAETVKRVQSVWASIIEPSAKKKTVLVCGHGNSLRALIYLIEGLSEEEVTGLELATGVPRLYDFEAGMWVRRDQ